jgi:hypothetical protein
MADSLDSDGARSSGTFVIGTQFAQARAAQQRLDEARSGQHSALVNLRYSSDESRLWRWVESPVDRCIETMVANFAGFGEEERNAVRDSLAMDDFYTLLTFVRRCALATLRSGDASKIERAFSAMAMIQLERIDWRDLLVANRLVRYAGQRLHAPVADLVSRTMQMAEPQTAEVLLGDRTTRIDLARSCGCREVCTSEGVALFDTGYERFSPKADLIGIAFAGAVASEDNGYEIGNVEVASDIPLTWLDGRDGSAIARMVREFSGCVRIHGVPRADPAPMSSGQSLLVFLAEAASEKDAREVASAADNSSSSLRTQIGLASGRLCAVIIQWSWMADTPPLDDVRSLERLRIVFEDCLCNADSHAAL